MNLMEKISEDLKSAMKNKEKEKLEAIRAVKTALLLARTESGAGDSMSDEEEIKLLVGIDEVISLKISQITYIETEKTVSHGITYHTMDNSTITVRDTIEHVNQMLKKDFLQCHRSILVNRKHIIGFEDNMIRLSNLELIPCAFRMKNEVKKCF